MKKFFKQTEAFILILTTLSLVVIGLIYSAIDKGNYYTLSNKPENIILGHSHTECAFNDSIIKHTRNLSNAGEDYFHTYFKIKKVLENNKIKNIFISFSNNQIEKNSDDYLYKEKYIFKSYTKYAANMDYNSFMILFKNNPKDIIKAQSITVKKYVLFLLKKDQCIIDEHAWGDFNYLKRDKIDSLLKNQKNIKRDLSTIDCPKINFDYLDKIIKLCSKYHVNLYFVRSPVHKRWDNFDNEFFLQKLLKTRFKNIQFLDFNNFPLKNDYYGDLDHINYKGSTKFSIFFNQLLEDGLLEKEHKQEFINQQMSKIRE